MKLISLAISASLLVAAFVMTPSTASAQEINQRLKNQHARIHQGIKNGNLTRNSARRLKARDRSIHAREHMDRMTQHGRLTVGEKHRLQHSLNRTSKAIYRDKHNGKPPK
jgi:type II secretory pathway component PulJ